MPDVQGTAQVRCDTCDFEAEGPFVEALDALKRHERENAGHQCSMTSHH